MCRDGSSLVPVWTRHYLSEWEEFVSLDRDLSLPLWLQEGVKVHVNGGWSVGLCLQLLGD